ncbi:hypothetical protein C0993_007679, partial [Termitomyces sp. T159_Od127]
MASVALGAAVPATPRAPAGGAKRPASSAKKSFSTKPSFKCRGHKTLRSEAPTQSDFTNKELVRLLVPRQVEAVVDTGVEASIVLKEIKSKAMVDLAICQAFKEEWGVCDKCWANNNPEGCWYPVGTPSCFRCVAMKRSCILDGAKTCKQGDASYTMVEKTYYQAVLVRRAWGIVERAREAKARSKTIAISKRSLALPMRQDKEGREGSKGKCKASLLLSPTDKGKKRAWVVLPAAVTPEVESKEEDEDEACHLAAAIEASKAVLGGDDLAGPSCQSEAPQDVGAQQEDGGQEEEMEIRAEATPQAQPW